MPIKNSPYIKNLSSGQLSVPKVDQELTKYGQLKVNADTAFCFEIGKITVANFLTMFLLTILMVQRLIFAMPFLKNFPLTRETIVQIVC